MADVVVVVGTRIRFSAELLRQFYERPDHRSPLVEVAHLSREPDGTVAVILTRIEEPCDE